MARLRQIMLEELRRRNFATTTIESYIHGVEHFSQYLHRPPDQLGPEHVRRYQAMLFTEMKFSPNTVIVRLAALRFFYVHVLKRNWSIAETPYPKKVLHLPQVLSQDEVARLIDAAEFPFHRILLMTLYATGARRAEVAHLKISDIDSRRMVIHIRGGKGRKDRDVMLSPKLLDALRVYWRGLKRKPTDWLFPGNRWRTASHPVSTKVLWNACQRAAERAGLEHKRIHPHRRNHAACRASLRRPTPPAISASSQPGHSMNPHPHPRISLLPRRAHCFCVSHLSERSMAVRFRLSHLPPHDPSLCDPLVKPECPDRNGKLANYQNRLIQIQIP